MSRAPLLLAAALFLATPLLPSPARAQASAQASAPAEDKVPPAPETGLWHPLSSTARAITGDVAFTRDKLILNLTQLPIFSARILPTSDLLGVFNTEGLHGETGKLYRLAIPAGRTFLHKNTLCGSDDTRWMATLVIGTTLQVAFFSGSTIPTFTPEALQNSTSLCGTFSYTR